MIDSASIAVIFSGMATCWIMGFSIGKSVAFIRAIRNVA